MAKEPPKKKGQSQAPEDAVGYGNPPRHTRFKPGVSGNPKGRPKYSEDGMLIQLIGQELYRPVRIQQDGVTSRQPAVKIVVRRMIMEAASKGDAKKVMATIRLAQMHSVELASQKSKIPPMTNEERLARIMEMLNKARQRGQKAAAKKNIRAKTRSKKRQEN